MSSVYHVNFDRLIGTGDPERDAYLVSLTIPDKPVMPSECYGHDIFKCGCEHCDGYLEAHREWRMAC